MACVGGAMEQEARFLESLSSARTFTVDGTLRIEFGDSEHLILSSVES